MISVRFGDELEKRVEQAAEARGMSVSAFIREAVEREVAVKPITLAERLKGIAGSLRGDGTSAAVAKKQIGQMMWEDHERKKRRVGHRQRAGRKSRR